MPSVHLFALLLALAAVVTLVDGSPIPSRMRALTQAPQCSTRDVANKFLGEYRGDSDICKRCVGDHVAW